VWLRSCVLRWPALVKALPHFSWRHVYGRTPVWTRKWVVTAPEPVKALPHPG
jgi:hypothetical protein